MSKALTCGDLIQVGVIGGGFEALGAGLQNGKAQTGLGERELGHGADVSRASHHVLVQLEHVHHLNSEHNAVNNSAGTPPEQ